MNDWIATYLAGQKRVVEALAPEAVAPLIRLLAKAWREDRQVFLCGNGGSAANASHFATDLGKGASDRLERPFRVMSLTDNVPWLTALGNDYAYEEVFVGQLRNFARPGDLLWVMSVSGNSPNLVRAVEWANEHGMETIALVGGRRGRLAELARHVLVVPDEHYGRVEDAHMHVCHLAAYAFMEGAADPREP
ncbi:MAG: SIS domain-containing protein [Verrucomicrobia bacterium]|nr:MAG: SIS domain-containing protein [Verrucomicrobiota bacterium]